MKEHASSPGKEVLVVRRRYFGDLILMAPVFRNLKARDPDCRITLVVDERYRDVLARHPDIDEIRGLPLRREGEGRWAFLRRWLSFVAGLRRRGFSVVYDLTQNDRSALVSILSGARRRVSFVAGRERLRHRFFRPRAVWTPRDRATLHSTELHLKVLEADGVPVETSRVCIPVPEEDGREAEGILESALGGPPARPLLLVHPGARTESKRWPADRMAPVLDRIAREGLARVLLIGGPGEDTVLRTVAGAMEEEPVLLPTDVPVPVLAALLARADLFLCHDSGPMHLAAAVGTRVVALFGASDPVRWRPRGEGHNVVRPSMPCPCPVPEKCRPPDPYKMWCVQRIEEDEVEAALRASLPL